MTILAAKRVEFVKVDNAKEPHWCGILNTHTPTQDKCDGIKDIFYGELECEHDQFPAYHTGILLGNYSAKL